MAEDLRTQLFCNLSSLFSRLAASASAFAGPAVLSVSYHRSRRRRLASINEECSGKNEVEGRVRVVEEFRQSLTCSLVCMSQHKNVFTSGIV